MTGITTNPTNLLENTHFIHHPTSKLSQIHAKSFPISITLKYHTLEPLDLRIFWHPRRIFQGAHIFQKRQIQYRMHTYFQFVSLVRKKNTLLEKMKNSSSKPLGYYEDTKEFKERVIEIKREMAKRREGDLR